MLKRFHQVEREVMKNHAYRIFKRYPLGKLLVKYFFNVILFEKVFFNNLPLRKFFEAIRYRMIMAR